MYVCMYRYRMAIVAVDKVPNCPNWDTNQKEILPETEKNERRMN